MIVSVSKNPNRSKSRWLRACVLLCAMIVLPLGVASAQDLDAVWKRLQTAVKKGEITEKQAHMMMGTLKKAAGENKDRDDKKRRDADKPNLEQIGKRLKAAVASGQMSEKDARAKWEAIAKEAKSRDGRREHDKGKPEHGSDDRKRAEAHIKEAWKHLQGAVKAGKMSEEDAHSKMGEIKREIHARLQGADRAREHLMKIRKELGAAVKAGKISREDARKKFAEAEKAVKARMAAGRGERGPKRITEEDLSHAGIEIRKAVASGRISAEQGRAKMAAMRKMVDREHQRGDDKDPKPDRAREHLMKIRKELGAAVEAGKISREDAGKRFAGAEKAIRERMAAGQRRRGRERDAAGKPARVDWESIKRRIEGAVKRGDMTRREADAKYKEIRERMGRRDERSER